MYVEVRDSLTKKLLFRYDPCRELIEIVVRQHKSVVDLKQFQEGRKQESGDIQAKQ